MVISNIDPMPTTITVRESTAEKLKRIMKEKHAKSIDQTINTLIAAAEGVPSSMFGVDAEKRVRLTKREHEGFQR
jgi:hypothetical protein